MSGPDSISVGVRVLFKDIGPLNSVHRMVMVVVRFDLGIQGDFVCIFFQVST